MNRMFLIILAMAFASVVNAEQVYVGSKKAKLYRQASFSSPVVSQLAEGDPLEVLGSQGRWLQVRHMALNGWVPRFTTTRTRPREQKISFLDRIKRFFNSSTSNRSRVSVISTTAGIRGLNEEEGAQGTERDFEAVERMEAMRVSEQEIDQFDKENER